MPSRPVNAELSTLVGLFHSSPDTLGQFEKVSPDEMPEPYRRLLVHRHHMTVAMEECHHGPVSVRVLKAKYSARHYFRQSLLIRESDERVVQLGIVGINFDYLDPEVRQEIVAERTPLGHILIGHNVLREIELMAVWRITPGNDLCRLFGVTSEQTTFGRTAIIHCDGQPALELLEISAPLEV